MRITPISAGKPTDAAFWTYDALERYVTESEYRAVERSDALVALTSQVTSAPKQSITSVFSGSLAIPANFMGLHVHNYVGSTPTTPRPALPIGALRSHDMRCHWPNIETSAGVYDWSTMDALVAWAQSIGAEICHTMAYTPNFYASDTSKFDQYGRAGGSSNPTAGGITAWGTYATAVATRYAGKIKYYEIWNEPNYRGSATVGTWFGTDAQLVTLAQTAYNAIKAADAAATVYAPAYFSEIDGGLYTNGLTTLGNYLAAGGGAYCDQVAYHFYLAFNRTPAYLPTYYDAVKAVMTANGIGAKPLTCSEIGNQENYTVNGQRPMGNEEKARWMARCMVYLAAKGAPRCWWYDYDGTVYDGAGRTHRMVDLSTYAETWQCYIWRQLATILPGSTLQLVNALPSGELAVVTSRGSAFF